MEKIEGYYIVPKTEQEKFDKEEYQRWLDSVRKRIELPKEIEKKPKDYKDFAWWKEHFGSLVKSLEEKGLKDWQIEDWLNLLNGVYEEQRDYYLKNPPCIQTLAELPLTEEGLIEALQLIRDYYYSHKMFDLEKFDFVTAQLMSINNTKPSKKLRKKIIALLNQAPNKFTCGKAKAFLSRFGKQISCPFVCRAINSFVSLMETEERQKIKKEQLEIEETKAYHPSQDYIPDVGLVYGGVVKNQGLKHLLIVYYQDGELKYSLFP